MTTQIKYVGLKDAEAAFQDKTGIVWTPGSSHPIEPALASRMLQHPDVFARDDAAPIAPAAKTTAKTLPPAPPAPVAPAANAEGDNTNAPKLSETSILVEGVAIELADLEKAALHDLAKKLEVPVHPNAGADNVRSKLLATFKASE